MVGGGNSLSIIRSLTKDIHVNIFDKILNNSFDGLFPLDYDTRMDSTWNAPNVHDWSALQNNTSGNCIQVVVDADHESGYGGNTFFYKAVDKATVYNGGIPSVEWIYSSFRSMFEIKD